MKQWIEKEALDNNLSPIQALRTGFANTKQTLMETLEFKLTPKESEVIALMLHGLTIGEIAKYLSRSKKTIYRHLENSKKKTHSANLFSLALKVKY